MKRKYTEISTIHKNNSYTLQFDVTANKPICIQQLKSDPTFVSFSSIDVYCLTETKALLVLKYQFVSCIQVPLIKYCIASQFFFFTQFKIFF